MNENPNARITDITKFVMEQDDFHEASNLLEDIFCNKEKVLCQEENLWLKLTIIQVTLNQG